MPVPPPSSPVAPPSNGGKPPMSLEGAPDSLPLFYANPRPLDRAQDAGMRVSRPSHFRFAAGTNAIPLLVDEFPLAAAYYPIVFADGPMPIPAAVVGLKNDSNLYIDGEGRWVAGSYLPAYVRRYPFILMDDPERKQFVLCIDEASDMLSPNGEFALFEGEQPSDFTKSAMEFCAVLRQQGDATDAFVKALKDYDLLRPNDAQIDMPDKTRLQLSGFLVIDPEKFDKLPDNVFLEWRKKGWIGLVYAQLLSSHRWQSLVELMQKHGS
ncbi:MAG TPA: SapC family protein [Alphaproteobacteria bacterium]|nr:SapC family protein [Alphaproteobacteria bacterium]